MASLFSPRRSAALYGPRPGIARQRLLADQLMAQGSSTAPVQSPVEGLARALTGALGGYTATLADRRESEKDQARTATLKRALMGATGGSDVPTPENAAALQDNPAYDPLVRSLMGNPETADMGFQLGVGNLQAQQQFERQQQLAQAEREYEANKPVSLSPGQTLLDPSQGYAPLASAPEKAPPGFTRAEDGSLQVDPNWMRAQKELRTAGSTRLSVNTGDQGPQFGNIPPGYMMSRTDEGWRMVPVPGSPAEQEEEQTLAQAEEKRGQREQSARIVIEDIDRVLDMMENATIPVTGIIGGAAKQVPGTSAYNAAKLLDTIKANVGFDKLQAMREASPTGGALGQVSEMENRLLQSVLGNLEQSQSEDQFRYNLQRLKDTFLDIVHGPGNRPDPDDATESPGGEGQFSGMSPQQLLGVDVTTLTPEQREEYSKALDAAGF